MSARPRTLGIFGTSGMARETRDVAVEAGWQCVFIAATDEDAALLPGEEEVMLEADIDGIGAPLHFAIGIGENRIREKIALRHGATREFVTLVHPSASFGHGQTERVHAARGVIVCAGVRFASSIRVGQFAIFNPNATIGHDSEIGDFVTVSPGANVSGNVRIGKGCWIGAGSAINQGQPGMSLVIGEGTVIGSGAVVTKHCEPDAVYAGVPARRIR